MRKIFPHIFVGISFLILLAMGTWQLQRLAWKESLIEKVNSRMNHEPIAIDDFKNIEEDEFTPITLHGKFDHDKEMVLLNKPFNGTAGYHVITPLITNEGYTILVNRGWTKSDDDPTRPQDEQTVTGIIRGTQKLNFIGRQVIFDNLPEKNNWFWVDLAAMYKQAEAETKPFYIEVTESGKPSAYPYGLPKKIELYNEHLQYAVTWYSLAAALLVIYYLRFQRKSAKKG